MRSLVFVISCLIVLAFLYDSGRAGRAPAPRSPWSGDDSTTDTTAGLVTGPSTRTDRQHDSLNKHTRYYVVEMDTSGDAPWNHIPWESIDQIYNGWLWTGRDSHFVLLGVGCLRISMHLGRRPEYPDTIRIRDTCRVTCPVIRTLPLGCEDSIEVIIPVIGTGRVVCDTTCYSTTIVTRDSSYALLSPVSAEQLFTYAGGCAPSGAGTICLRKQPSGQWLISMAELSNPLYPHKGCQIGVTCADTVCCIDRQAFWHWLGTFGYTYVPGVVTVSVSDTIRYQVPCHAVAGLPGIVRETSNCRTIPDTTYTRSWRAIFVPAGRDTTFEDDECDCLAPRIECIPGQFDSTPVYRPLYAKTPLYDTTYDTATCTRIYQIPSAVTTYYYPAPRQFCISDADWAALEPGSTGSYSAGRIPVLVGYGGWTTPCRLFWCDFDIEWWAPDPNATYRWILASAVADSCNRNPRCLYDVQWTELEGDCCATDTSIAIVCVPEIGAEYVIDTLTWAIPVSPCDSNSITPTITITGWVDSLIRIDTLWTTTWVPAGYRIRWEDTCYCRPLIYVGNDPEPIEICDPIYIRSECDPQPYKVGRTIVFPCRDEAEAQATITINGISGSRFDSLVTYGYLRHIISMLQDSLATLRASIAALDARINALEDTAAAHRALLDGMQTPTCGGGALNSDAPYGVLDVAYAAEPTHVSVTYKGATARTYPLRWEWQAGEGVIRIYGDPDASISYCIYP